MARSTRWLWLAAPLALALLGSAPPELEQPAAEAAAAPAVSMPPKPPPPGYELLRAGHPLRIVAYALHPVGVILDYLILRPAYWIGSHEPIKTLVGQGD